MMYKYSVMFVCSILIRRFDKKPILYIKIVAPPSLISFYISFLLYSFYIFFSSSSNIYVRYNFFFVRILLYAYIFCLIILHTTDSRYLHIRVCRTRNDIILSEKSLFSFIHTHNEDNLYIHIYFHMHQI